MKKKSVMFLLVILMIALLAVFPVPVSAGPSENVSGLWQYQPFLEGIRFADGNTFMETFENGKWSGTFSGTSTEDGKVVLHSSGAWSFRGIISFVGEVEGRSGTLTMIAIGTTPDDFTDWTGTWVILSGTGELANLHGQGTWWGPGAADFGVWGDIYYSGEIHFEP